MAFQVRCATTICFDVDDPDEAIKLFVDQITKKGMAFVATPVPKFVDWMKDGTD